MESQPERPGFTGHLYQKELGLTYMQAWHYDPLMGRSYGNDPVSFMPGNVFSFSRYGCGNSNPYRYVAPDGRFGVLAGFAAKFAGKAALNATLNNVETGEFRLGDAATDAAKNLVNPASMVKNTVKVMRIADKVGGKLVNKFEKTAPGSEHHKSGVPKKHVTCHKNRSR